MIFEVSTKFDCHEENQLGMAAYLNLIRLHTLYTLPFPITWYARLCELPTKKSSPKHLEISETTSYTLY